MKTPLLALVVLLGIAALAALLFFARTGPLAPGAVGPPSAASAPSAAASAEPMLARAQDGEREAAALERASVESTSEAPETAAAAPAVDAILTGRVVDARGFPLAGAQVQLRTRAGKEFEPAASEPASEARSDAHGRFRLAVGLPEKEIVRRGRVSVLVPRFALLRADVELRAGTQDLGDLVPMAAGNVAGRVVGSDGAALAGARVIAIGPGIRAGSGELSAPREIDVETISGSDGRFLLEGVPEGARHVGAGLENWFWGYAAEITVEANRTLGDVLVQLEPIPAERWIVMRVLDPAGAPLPDAEIQYSYRTPRQSGTGSSNADENGIYRHLTHVAAPHRFQAGDPQNRYRPAIASDVEPGVADLVLQLGELRSIAIFVRGADGPLEDFAVQALSMPNEGGFDQLSGGSGKPPYSGGRADLIVPAERFRVSVTAVGYAQAERGPFEPDAAPETLDFELLRLPGVRGIVTAGGEPIGNAKVSLHGAASNWILMVNGFDARSNRDAEAQTESKADGSFEIALGESGSYWVRAEADGWAPADVGPFEIEASVGLTGTALDLARGGAIEGRVLMPDGESPAGSVVGISRGDGCGQTRRADARGSFRFEGLTPGPWYVALHDQEITPNSTTSSTSSGTPPPMTFNCEVRSGQTTQFDIDSSRSQAVALKGRFLLGGVPARGWKVTLHPKDDFVHEREAILDAQGGFRLSGRSAGSYTLKFSSKPGVVSSSHFEFTLELPEGESPWHRDVPVGALWGNCGTPGESEDRLSAWAVCEQGDLSFHGDLVLASDGSYRLEPVPAGEVVMRRFVDGQVRDLGRSLVPSGGEARFDLP